MHISGNYFPHDTIRTNFPRIALWFSPTGIPGKLLLIVQYPEGIEGIEGIEGGIITLCNACAT